MPYKNAADVRAQHPGVYDDLTDQQIEQGLAKTAASAPVDDGALGERYHPNSADTPDSAFIGELARTGKEAAIGLARSPLDMAKGIAGTVMHPLDTLMGVGHTIAHPIEAVENLAKSPRDAGSLLGQMLLAPKVPGAANTALAEGPGIIGRGVSAVGRGAEAVGTSKALQRATPLGSFGTAMSGHPGMAALELAAPPALEYGGKGLQKLGGALEGLDLSFKGRTPIPEATIPEARRLGPARFSTEVPNYGKQLDALDGPGHWERSPSDNPLVPERRNGAMSVRGLKDAVDDSVWAGDKSAQPDVPLDSRITGLSPIEEFYKNDPQARGVGGNIAEGRMTGQFTEGKGGLADLDAGRLARYDTKPDFTHEGFLKDLQGSLPDGVQPSPLDELSRLSGHALTPEEIQKLLDRFKGWEPE